MMARTRLSRNRNNMILTPLREMKEEDDDENILDLHKSHGFKVDNNKLTAIRHPTNEPQDDCPVIVDYIHTHIQQIKLKQNM